MKNLNEKNKELFLKKLRQEEVNVVSGAGRILAEISKGIDSPIISSLNGPYSFSGNWRRCA